MVETHLRDAITVHDYASWQFFVFLLVDQKTLYHHILQLVEHLTRQKKLVRVHFMSGIMIGTSFLVL